jgi:hypothetical protein
MNDIVKRDDTQVSDTTAIIQVIERAAMNPDVDIEKMERLLAMQERIMGKQAEAEFNRAMRDAQKHTRRIAADASNQQTRSRYATYAALDRVLRPIYTDVGFSISFDTGEPPQPECVRVVAYVSHESGYTRTYHADMPADGKGAKGGDAMTKTHAAGSAMSYGMRYLLKMIFNVAIGEDDDDGNTACVETITEQEIAELKDRLADVGEGQETAFLAAMKASSFAGIQRAAYQDALAMIERKRKRMESDNA